jgi:hypothetical protein
MTKLNEINTQQAVEDNKINNIDNTVDSYKKTTNSVLSDENLEKQKKILSCIRREKFKDLKNILN